MNLFMCTQVSVEFSAAALPEFLMRSRSSSTSCSGDAPGRMLVLGESVATEACLCRSLVSIWSDRGDRRAGARQHCFKAVFGKTSLHRPGSAQRLRDRIAQRAVRTVLTSIKSQIAACRYGAHMRSLLCNRTLSSTGTGQTVTHAAVALRSQCRIDDFCDSGLGAMSLF